LPLTTRYWADRRIRPGPFRRTDRVAGTENCVETDPDKYVAEGGTIAEANRGALVARDLEILAFERRWWQHAGAKEEAIRRELGLRPADYYQALSRLLDDPAALDADPGLIDQLRRLRATRHRRRTSRSVSTVRNQSGG
jgi:hypothetical protein